VLKPFSTIIFSFLLLSNVVGQSIQQTLSLAERMHANGNYESAAKYFKRVSFFGSDSLQAAVFPVLGKLYQEQNDLKQSLFFYQLASNTAPNDSLYNEYIFSQALCNILIGETNLALQNVYSYNDYGSVKFTRRYHFYLGLIFLEQDKPELSQENFLLATDCPEKREKINTLFSETDITKPNPLTAKILSVFLPGLGQAYAGNYFSAMNSFALNMGLITLMGITMYNLSFLDGALSVGPWLQRYYMGGLNSAERVAINRRIEKKNILKSSVIQQYFD
jgi:tetratricopeptide (TPR) repeat protein